MIVSCWLKAKAVAVSLSFNTRILAITQLILVGDRKMRSLVKFPYVALLGLSAHAILKMYDIKEMILTAVLG